LTTSRNKYDALQVDESRVESVAGPNQPASSSRTIGLSPESVDELSASPTTDELTDGVKREVGQGNVERRRLKPSTNNNETDLFGGVQPNGDRWAITEEKIGLSELHEGERAPLPTDTPDHGNGPGEGGDKFDVIVENDFVRSVDSPLSTFSIDVDTASYAKVRMFLHEHHQLPRPDAVRIEELINYFTYHYAAPSSGEPFAAHLAVANCPWNAQHHLVRIAIKGKEVQPDRRPASNLVFLLDVSGSMDEPNKLPLLQDGMRMLTRQLSENDRVAIVVYAGAAGKVLDSTTGDQQTKILEALDRLRAGGSTNGGAGIQLAYQTALDHFIPGGVNRVILCTDGDFNVGTTGTDELVRVVEQHAKSGVFLSVLGFGMGNHNDSMLEQISNKGNGNYAFVDTEREARKVLVDQMSATLVTIAKDVKIQVEFNPAEVSAYRLLGYENRILAAQDFNDDKKDAGEIGAGHTVTALYEIAPVGQNGPVVPPIDELKYQVRAQVSEAAGHGELLTLKLRYKEPAGETSTLLSFPLKNASQSFADADRDFQFAAAVASFGMLLRDSKYKGNATFASVLEVAGPAAQHDPGGYRQEFLQLVRKAAELSGQAADRAVR
jgi:Ca-activated chloride channel family protein